MKENSIDRKSSGISVIICTFNPRLNYLQRTLEALSRQTLNTQEWELILIDNGDKHEWNTAISLGWHPFARIVHEPTAGLTHARLRGISESSNPLIIFVDDDNLLKEDYLETALQIAESHPHIGAWGGQAIPEFEIEPPAWIAPYLGLLALRQFQDDRWTNIPGISAAMPFGAGLCVRRSVAQQYAKGVHGDSFRQQLDRSGSNLNGCGDVDLAYTAFQKQLGIGLFSKLVLTHLIPSTRFSETYLLGLTEGNAFSHVFIKILHENENPLLKNKSLTTRLADILRYLIMSPRRRRFYKSARRGLVRAFNRIKACKADSNPASS
ncbi:MAG TPA: glycosyltransferase [Chryseolinea sp.]